MAGPIAYDFDELRGYLKRLQAATGEAVGGDQVSTVVGPPQHLGATASYRHALGETARLFGDFIDQSTIRFSAVHDSLMAALEQAIETDDANADDIRKLMTALEGMDASANPAPTKHGAKSAEKGVIG